MPTTLLLSLLIATTVTGATAAENALSLDTIGGVEIRLTPSDPAAEAQLASYLKRYIGIPASESVAIEAQARLLSLPHYERASCRLQAQEQFSQLRCSLSQAPLVGRIRFEGLPPQVLEGDLRRRLFVRVGDPLGAGQSDVRGRLQRQRERLEQHLQRIGYYDAKVRIETPRIGTGHLVELRILIAEGRFLYVGDVTVEGHAIVPPKEIERAFRYMCLGGDGWLTLLETGRMDCFTRARLQTVTQTMEREFQRRGYPDARLRVSAMRHPPSATNARCSSPGILAERQAKPATTEADAFGDCVSIHVKIEAGLREERWLSLATEEPSFAVKLGTQEFNLGDWLSDVAQRGDLRQGVSRALQIAANLPLSAASDTEISAKGLSATAERKEGMFLAVAPIDAAKEWIENQLAETGYPAAVVEVIVEALGQETPPVQRVTFRVQPGSPTAIREIRFFGNRAFSAETLQNRLEMLRPRSLRHAGFFTASQLEVERRSLETFYESNGYPDAQVRARTEQHLDEIIVFFSMEEGPRYQVSELRIQGGEPGLIPSFLPLLAHCRGGRAAQEHRAPITVGDCQGAPLQPKALDSDAASITKVYASRGYPYIEAKVSLAPEWTPDGAVLLVELTHTPNRSVMDAPQPNLVPSRATLGEIFIVGNHRTSPDAILRESDLPQSGELLTPMKVAQSIGRLRRTGLFSRVDYRYLGKDLGDDELALLLLLEERPAGSIDFAASFSTQDLMELSAEWRDRNLWGRMLDAAAQAELGLFIGRRSNLEIRLEWPRILGTDLGLQVHPRAVYSDHPTIRVASAPSTSGPVAGLDAYQAVTRRRIFSAGVKVGMEWSPQFSALAGMQGGLDYELHTAWDDPNAGRIPLFDQHTYGGWAVSLPSEQAVRSLDGLVELFQQEPTRIATLGPRFRVHRVVNPLDPSGGWAMDGAIVVAHPVIGASQPSLLLHSGARWYKSLHADLVLALHGNVWGGVTEVEAGSRSPLLQPGLISLGGDRTVRGYSYDAPFGVPLLAAQVAAGERTGVIPLLGSVTNAEVRWTAVRGLFLGDLKFAGFIDAGFVTDDAGLPWTSSWQPWLSPGQSLQALLDATPQRVGVGVGGGVRYVMPIGPLALDIAFSPLTLRPQVHLQFGYSF